MRESRGEKWSSFKWSSAAKKAFDANTLDARAHCNHCKRTSIVRSWKCKCGIAWHACETHIHAPVETRKFNENKKGIPTKKRNLDKTRSKDWKEVESPKCKKSKVTLWEEEAEDTEVTLGEQKRSIEDYCSTMKLPPSLMRKFRHDVQ